MVSFRKTKTTTHFARSSNSGDDLLGSKDERKKLDTQFKKAESNFKIAIVVDMWLTGFDVPFLDTIYIDKPVQRHNLIQTISRVNRKFENKKKGLVVDYIGIKKQMNLALAHYSKADSSNIEEIEASIIVVRDHLDLLARIFHQFDTTPYFRGSPLEQLHCLNRAAEYVQLTDKIEKRVMFLVKRLKAAYDICSGSDAFAESGARPHPLLPGGAGDRRQADQGRSARQRPDERQGARDDLRGPAERRDRRDLQTRRRRRVRDRHLRRRLPRQDREGQAAQHQDQAAPATAQARHRGLQEGQQDQREWISPSSSRRW